MINSVLKKVCKPETFRDLGPVATAELVKLVQQLPDRLWELEDERKENKFAVFHHTQHIIFRFTPGNRDPRETYTNPIWQVWRRHLLPLMDAITSQYQHRNPVYSKIMLARLLASNTIDRHVDGAGANLHTHKVHVPLITNPLALFTIDDETRHLDVGRAWEVNNIAPHAVENMGTDHRVHLIFEHFDMPG